MTTEAGLTRDFIGLNKQKPVTNLGPNEAAEAKNVIVSRHRIEKRPGSYRFSPFAIPKPAAYFTADAYRSTPPISSTDYSGLGYLFNTQFTLEIAGRIQGGTSTTTHILAQRGYSDSGAANGWSLRFRESDKTFRFLCKVDSGSDIDVTGTWTNYASNKPFHVALWRSSGVASMWLKDSEESGAIGSQSGITDAAVETQTANTFPLTFGTGVDPAATSTPFNLQGSIQEFRTWDYARSTNSISEWALRELTPHAVATNSLKFYHKLNEGTGAAYDYGFLARAVYTTLTEATAAFPYPEKPQWVTGLVAQGIGDKAVRLNGINQYISWLIQGDELATLRTGTSDWSFQFNTRPQYGIQTGDVFLMYGNATHTPGSNGFAFRVKAEVDLSVPRHRFVADFCFTTETNAVTWSTNFTHSNVYGITLQRVATEVRMRVDDLTEEIPGAWVTAAIVDSTVGGPQFDAGLEMIAGANAQVVSHLQANPLPSSNFCRHDIDEVRAWSGVRYEPQNVMYANVSDSALLGYWKFNDGSGSTIRDSSTNDVKGYLIPNTEYPRWSSGWVEPVNGPEITGIFYYEKQADIVGIDDARERTLLVEAGNSIYRNEGGAWNPIESGRVQGYNSVGAQLENQFIICDGVNENRLYDGDAMWSNGLAAPTEPATSSVLVATGTWDTLTSINSPYGVNMITSVDLQRTEPTGSFDGKRVTTWAASATVSMRCKKFSNNETIKIYRLSTLSTDSSWLYCIGDFFTHGVTSTYALEHADLVAYDNISNFTHTFAIRRDEWPNQNNNFNSKIFVVETPSTASAFQFSRCSILLNGHFFWETAFTDTVYGTSTYQINLEDGSVTGNFYYRYTNYNRTTDIQSNPSPPSDYVAAPNSQQVNVTIPYSTDTSVTDRLIWRTKRDGGQRSYDYFLLGTATGTGTVVYADVTPAGEEGERISYWRSVPPKSSVCLAFKGRMWYVPVSTPNYVYFSEVGRPAEVDEYNYLRFGEETDHITALGVWEDNLVVWKRRSTWLVPRADVPIGVSPVRISSSVGCVSHHSVADCNGEVVFLGEQGVSSLRGSSIRKVSSDKVQYYIDKLDPSRLHKAVGWNVSKQGIYRLNLSPYTTWATTVNASRNSWYLDFHYQRSRDHVPFYESIWTYGEREVSAAGKYVTEDNLQYEVIGDYRGFVAIDDVPTIYSEGYQWYRTSATYLTTDDLSVSASSGDYTLTVAGALYTGGHGMKGLKVLIRDSSNSESHIVAANGTTTIVLQTALATDFATGASVYIAPIESAYKSGMYDFGSTLRDKAITYVKVDHEVESTSSTLTLGVYGGRGTTVQSQTVQTHTLDLSVVTEKQEVRVRGKHAQIAFQHDWPGEKFEVFGWEWEVEAEGNR